MEKMLQVLQMNVNISIPSNTENNPKREGKGHVKGITLCLRMMVRDLVRQSIMVVDNENDDTPTFKVKQGLCKNEEDNEIR
ncbi:hypothetical protein J1N35_014714, partial [Gossypium stocksii]